MSLIFDSFPTMEDAEAFVVAVKERFGLDGQTFRTDEEAQRDDWFPSIRKPFIAHIDRVDEDDIDTVAAEERVEKFAFEFGGEFIGT